MSQDFGPLVSETGCFDAGLKRRLGSEDGAGCRDQQNG
jgi:hypothetical protein